jgi:hypothetical protein
MNNRNTTSSIMAVKCNDEGCLHCLYKCNARNEKTEAIDYNKEIDAVKICMQITFLETARKSH